MPVEPAAACVPVSGAVTPRGSPVPVGASEPQAIIAVLQAISNQTCGRFLLSMCPLRTQWRDRAEVARIFSLPVQKDYAFGSHWRQAIMPAAEADKVTAQE